MSDLAEHVDPSWSSPRCADRRGEILDRATEELLAEIGRSAPALASAARGVLAAAARVMSEGGCSAARGELRRARLSARATLRQFARGRAPSALEVASLARALERIGEIAELGDPREDAADAVTW